MSNLTENLWAVDIETGGLKIGVPVIEVAYGPVFGGEQTTVLWNTTARKEQCSPEALAINHCFDEDRPHSPQERRVDERWMAHIIEADLRGRVLVGQNTHFDAGHLEALLQGYGLRRSWSYRLVNLSSLVVGYLAGQLQAFRATQPHLPTDGHLAMPLKGWSQKDAAELMGVPPVTGELAHTAAGDVENVKAIVRKVFNA